MKEITNFLNYKMKVEQKENEKRNPYEKIGVFYDIQTKRKIEILKHKYSEKVIFNLKK